MVRVRSHRRRAVGLAMLVLTLSACTGAPATIEGGRVEALYNLFLVAAATVFAVVAGLIGWNIVRYRARTGDEGLPPQTHGQMTLEIVWWAIPTLLVIGLFAASAVVLNANDARDAADPLRVKVEASQWEWRFTYPASGVVVTGAPGAPPQLVLPTGEPIDFEIVSDDVIHSFFIPGFLVKRDAIPGVDNHLQLTISQAGIYNGQCAEFCGLLHDRMLFSIRAVSPREFSSWLATLPGGGG